MTLHLTDYKPGDRLTVTHTEDPTIPVDVPGIVKLVASEGFLSVRFDGETVNLGVLPGSDTVVRLPGDDDTDPAPCRTCEFVGVHDDCGGCYACEGGDCPTCHAGIIPVDPDWAPVQGPQPAPVRDEALDRLAARLNRPA